MTPRTTPRTPWAIDGTVAAYAIGGAVLYGILGLFAVTVGAASARPGFALVPFVGYTAGPVAGFVAGFGGQGIVDLVAGAPGFSWSQSLASGAAGLVAGLAWLLVPRLVGGSLRDRALGGAVAGVVGSLVGGLLLLLIPGPGQAGNVQLDAVVAQVAANAIVSAVLVPVLVYAWAPIIESIRT
jgi:uncharacterized membrane protein